MIVDCVEDVTREIIKVFLVEDETKKVNSIAT